MKMNKRYFSNRNALMLTVRKLIKPVEVVLDIGCGIQPQNYITPVVHICCEPFGDYIEHLRSEIRKGKNTSLLDRNFVFLQATGAEIVRFFPKHSVDTVFLLDVIEHLEKKEGIELLALAEGIARCQVVVFTPLGFVKQEHPDGKDAWGMNGGSWQAHKSGWLPEDFDESWQIFVTEKFHFEDNLGKPYLEPIGAFFAIKTMSNQCTAAKPRASAILGNKFNKKVGTMKIWIETIPFYDTARKLYRSIFSKKTNRIKYNEKDK